jgi:hypothetical protein
MWDKYFEAWISGCKIKGISQRMKLLRKMLI